MTDAIPREDHVSRYYERRHSFKDGRPTSTAFYYSKNDPHKKCISVNWNEYHTPDLDDSVPHICNALRKSLNTKSDGKIAILSVRRVDDKILGNFKGSRIYHDPMPPNNMSHSCIFINSPDKVRIAGSLCRLAGKIYDMGPRENYSN